MRSISSFLFLLSASIAMVTAGERRKPIPLRWGILAYPEYQGLDAYGPLDILNVVKYYTPNMTIDVIAETLDPVPASTFNLYRPVAYMKPTHTIYENVTLDVLLIPGGASSSMNTNIINYVKNVYPKLKYIISVCTGAQILARAGVLHGKRATTSKFAWAETTQTGPGVNWVPCARWVTDGNVWTSSGVAAGIDLTYAFIKEIVRNETLADLAANILEIDIHKDSSWDPFCEIWNVTKVGTAV